MSCLVAVYAKWAARARQVLVLYWCYVDVNLQWLSAWHGYSSYTAPQRHENPTSSANYVLHCSLYWFMPSLQTEPSAKELHNNFTIHCRSAFYSFSCWSVQKRSRWWCVPLSALVFMFLLSQFRAGCAVADMLITFKSEVDFWRYAYRYACQNLFGQCRRTSATWGEFRATLGDPTGIGYNCVALN